MKLIIWTLFLAFNLTLAINLGDLNSNQLLTIQGSSSDSKNYQYRVSNAGDVNGDGKDDLIIGSYGDSDKESAYLIYGTSTFTPVNINFQTYTMTPASAGVRFQQAANYDGFGQAVSSAGDIDGDGFVDILIGANRKKNLSGYLYVIYGGSGLPGLFNFATTTLDPKSNGFMVMSTETEYQLGWSVSKAGRFNEDGFDDIVIGIRQYGASKSRTGAVFVIYGGLRTSRSNINFKSDGTFDVSGAGFVILGNNKEDYFGHAVANAGDINKDGYDDIIVGAPNKDSNKGVVYVFYGGPTANLGKIDLKNGMPAGRGFIITGGASDDYFGWSVSGAGDVNKDGYADMIIGAYGKDGGKGMAYIVYGGSSPQTVNIANLDPATTGFTVRGAAAGDQLGYSVRNVSDLNKDGKSELIIGANGQGGSSKGAVFIVYGGRTSHLDLGSTTLDPTKDGFMISRDTANANFGFSVASGDFDGDNKPELFVGTTVTAQTVNASYVIDLSKMCADGCAECWIPTMCDVCSVNYQLMSSIQCKACKIGTGEYYSIQKTCEPCMGHCDTCQNSGSCDICSNTYGYQNSACITCPDYGKFKSGVLCKNCIADCKTCSSETTCDICSSGFGVENNACINCPRPGKFQDGVRCTNCLQNCDECENAGTCKKCFSDYGRWNSNTECIECPTSGKFKSGEDCIDCLPNCETCSETGTCESCKEDFGRWNFNTECINCPQTGKFLDGGECFDCIGNCDVCSNNKTCETCLTDYGRWNLDTECINCPQTGKFLSGGECFNCIDNCDDCSDATTCNTCLTGFGKYDGKCEICPPTTYLKNSVCETCIDDCDKCSDDASCEYCSNGFGLLNSVCVDPCPEKMYLSDDRICKNCISGCDQCSKEGTCDYCSNGYGLLDSVCVDICPVKMRLSDDRICKNCISNCDQCSDDLTCDYCSSGFGLLKSVCVDPCPVKKYLSADRICKACVNDCDKCSDSTTCEVCSSGFGLLNSVCISCPLKMYLSNDGKCEDCIPSCDVCSGSSSCLKCSSGYGLLNSRCVKCPTGMFLSPNGQCLTCSPNCTQCLNSTSCQVCSDGYGVLNSKCASNPQEGLYLSNGTFFACSEGCSQCADSSICQVCADDYMLSDWNTCVEKKEESENVGSSSTFEGATLIGAAFSSGGSLPFNFGLVSKMVRNVKYLNISVSSDLRQSFVSWTATSNFLKAPESWNSKSETRSRILQEVFGRYGLEPAFLINYWKTLILTLVGVVLFAIFKAIEGINIGPQGVNIAASNFALTQFYSNLDDVVLYLVIDARSAKLDTSFGATSFTIGIILLIIGGIALCAHIWLLRKYQSLKRRQAANEFKAFRSKSQNVDLLFKDFKDMGYSTQSFLLVYLIRCIVSSLIFALLFDYPFLQIIMLLILNACMMTFLVVVRPFKDFFDSCGQVFSEFILLLVNICMFILAIFDQVGKKPLEAIDKLSRCVIVLNVILLVGCAIFLVISILRLLHNLYKIYQDKKKNKSTSKTLSSLTKKLDQLKHTQNTDRKTSGFEHGSDTQQGLQSEDISDSNMGLNGQQSFHSRINTQFFYTEQGQMLTQQEMVDTENLDFSGFFVASKKNKGGAQMRSSEMKKFKGEVEDIEAENMERSFSNSGVWNGTEMANSGSYLNGKNTQVKNGGGQINTPEMRKFQGEIDEIEGENEVENLADSRTLNHEEVELAQRELQLQKGSQIKSPEMRKFHGEIDEIEDEYREENQQEGVFKRDDAENMEYRGNYTERGIQLTSPGMERFEGEVDEIEEDYEEKSYQNYENFSYGEAHRDMEPNEGIQVKSPEVKKLEGEIDEIEDEYREENRDISKQDEAENREYRGYYTDRGIQLTSPEMERFEGEIEDEIEGEEREEEEDLQSSRNFRRNEIAKSESRDYWSDKGSQIKSSEMKKFEGEVDEIEEENEERNEQNYKISNYSEAAYQKYNVAQRDFQFEKGNQIKSPEMRKFEGEVDEIEGENEEKNESINYGEAAFMKYNVAQRDLQFENGNQIKSSEMRKFEGELDDIEGENGEEIEQDHSEAANVESRNDFSEKGIQIKSPEMKKFKGEVEEIEEENIEENLPNYGVWNQDEKNGYFVNKDLQFKKGESQIRSPEMKKFEGEIDAIEVDDEEENLENMNYQEATDLNDSENQIKNNVIPLQGFEATFSIKKKTLPAENIKKNDEDADIDLSENQIQNNMIPLQDFGAAFEKKKAAKPGNMNENFSNSEIMNNDESANVESSDIENLEDQTEENVTPLQESEATFNKQKKAIKAEDIRVEHMREDISSDFSS